MLNFFLFRAIFSWMKNTTYYFENCYGDERVNIEILGNSNQFPFIL